MSLLLLKDVFPSWESKHKDGLSLSSPCTISARVKLTTRISETQ